MNTYSSLTFLLLSFIVGSPVMSGAKPEKKENDTTRKILSKHITTSTYEGAQFRRCRGRTARCPENCGNSGEFAKFTINEYLTYEKPGKYGDPKQKQYLIQISDFHKKPKGDADILKVIKGITKGDKVRLAWNHNYVTRKGSSFPERVVKELKKLESR